MSNSYDLIGRSFLLVEVFLSAICLGKLSQFFVTLFLVPLLLLLFLELFCKFIDDKYAL